MKSAQTPGLRTYNPAAVKGGRRVLAAEVPCSVWPWNSGPAPVVPSTLWLCDHSISHSWPVRIKLLPSEYCAESAVRVNRKVDQTDGRVLPAELQLTSWFSLAERSGRGSQAWSITVLLSHVWAKAAPVPPPSLLQHPHIHVKGSTPVPWATGSGQMWGAAKTVGPLTHTSLSWVDQVRGCSEGPRTALITEFAVPDIPFFPSHT